MNIIGLSGYARSGKNEVGQILEDDYGFRQESFAQALKNVAAEINPVLNDTFGGYRTLAALFLAHRDWDAVKDAVPAAREFLQRLGVACRDQIGPDVWVDALARRLSVHPSARYVITDVRFPNEAEFITNRGGQVWRIERSGTRPVNGHTSETALDGWSFDRTIVNDGSLADLRVKVLENGGVVNLQRLYRLSFDTPPTTPTVPVVESERRPARPLPDHYREAKP